MALRNQRTNRDGFVLITGGRGFIGRELGKLLQRSGYRVLSLDIAAASLQTCDDAIELSCDISDEAELQKMFESHSIWGIVHLAAILPTMAQQEPLHATKVNVVGSINVLELARRFGVTRIVFGSSLSVYGSCPVERVVSEQDRAAPEDLYGASKVYVEQLGDAYADRCGIEFISLRIGRVLGPGSHSKTSAWRSQIFELLHAASKASVSLPYIASERLLLAHVHDIARMLMTLLESRQPKFALYNAPSESVVVRDLKQIVEALNPNISVDLGDSYAAGNPRMLDCSRFLKEFDVKIPAIADRLRAAAEF